MVIDENFLITRFTDITLFHILILLGIPYIIFYIFERFTRFDKFHDKWEGAIFVFVFGGISFILSLLIQDIIGVPFIISYLFLIIAFSALLILVVRPRKSSKGINSLENVGWVMIKLKNGDRYKGVLIGRDNDFIKISAGRKDKIAKILGKEEKEIKANEILFNKKEVLGIFFTSRPR